MQENSKRTQAFKYLDANASVFTSKQLQEELVREFQLKPSSATSYISAWRNNNGVSRKYVRKERADV